MVNIVKKRLPILLVLLSVLLIACSSGKTKSNDSYITKSKFKVNANKICEEYKTKNQDLDSSFDGEDLASFKKFSKAKLELATITLNDFVDLKVPQEYQKDFNKLLSYIENNHILLEDLVAQIQSVKKQLELNSIDTTQIEAHNNQILKLAKKIDITKCNSFLIYE